MVDVDIWDILGMPFLSSLIYGQWYVNYICWFVPLDNFILVSSPEAHIFTVFDDCRTLNENPCDVLARSSHQVRHLKCFILDFCLNPYFV